MTFSVKLTRTEYMEFCAKSRRKALWTAALGMILLLGAIAVYLIEGYMLPITWLLVAVGLFLVTAELLWLPMREKGAAGRRYDASDALSQAMMVTVENDVVTVRTVCMEGTVPLSLMTAKKVTADMVALVFGDELTVFIPCRAVSEDEWTSVLSL